jgi:hypothetical protein
MREDLLVLHLVLVLAVSLVWVHASRQLLPSLCRLKVLALVLLCSLRLTLRLAIRTLALLGLRGNMQSLRPSHLIRFAPASPGRVSSFLKIVLRKFKAALMLQTNFLMLGEARRLESS